MLSALVLAVAFGAFLYLVYRSPPAAYALLAATVAANGLFIDVGVAVSASRLLTLAFLVWAALRADALVTSPKLRGISVPAFALLAYVLVVTAASQAFFLPPIAGELSEVRESSRWLIQWFSFCVSIAPLLIAPLALESTDDCARALRGFVQGVAAMCALAVVQWCSVQFFDTPILGIARHGLLGPDYDASFFLAGDVIVQRANGLAREPKDLAAAAAIALTILGLVGLPGRAGSRRQLLWLGLLLFGGLVVSFATTGAFLAALGGAFVAMSVATAPDQAVVSRSGLRRIWVVAVVVAGIALLAFLQSDYFDTILQERVTSRLGMLEDYDEVTLAFLLDNLSVWPTGVGAGLLPFFANDYLPNDPVLLEYMANYTWDAKAGLLRWLGSFGLVGCSIAGFLLYRVFSRLSRALDRVAP
ncbi:MAG TPA: hypothetical protein VLS49_13340, partial [Usitatibacter sp.]|nr:hypothetical protein [Usitatibacter sp.]